MNTSLGPSEYKHDHTVINNRTFLPIDALLYHKSAIQSTDQDNKQKPKSVLVADDIPGLKGYGAAAQKVFNIMNNQSNEKGNSALDSNIEDLRRTSLNYEI